MSTPGTTQPEKLKVARELESGAVRRKQKSSSPARKGEPIGPEAAEAASSRQKPTSREKPRGYDKVDEALAEVVAAKVQNARQLSEESEIESIAGAVLDDLCEGKIESVKQLGKKNRTYSRVLELLAESGVNPSYIMRCVRARCLDGSLPEETKGKLTFSNRRVLVGVSDLKLRDELATQAAREAWPKSKLEAEVRTARSKKIQNGPAVGRRPDNELEVLSKALQRIKFPAADQIAQSVLALGAGKAGARLGALQGFSAQIGEVLNRMNLEIEALKKVEQDSANTTGSTRKSCSTLPAFRPSAENSAADEVGQLENHS